MQNKEYVIQELQKEAGKIINTLKGAIKKIKGPSVYEEASKLNVAEQVKKTKQAVNKNVKKVEELSDTAKQTVPSVDKSTTAAPVSNKGGQVSQKSENFVNKRQQPKQPEQVKELKQPQQVEQPKQPQVEQVGEPKPVKNTEQVEQPKPSKETQQTGQAQKTEKSKSETVNKDKKKTDNDQDFIDQAKEKIKKNPYAATGIAAGGAFGLGYLLGDD